MIVKLRTTEIKDTSLLIKEMLTCMHHADCKKKKKTKKKTRSKFYASKSEQGKLIYRKHIWKKYNTL